jgi:demethylmenaquinone methyltransferase/2-methoxy-6-polyprenyl-1,4-benzoquinol methylase
MTENKDHWYDGRFYDRVIAPNQDRMFRQIRDLIAPESTVIDIGCGTGRFSCSIADKCSSVAGIDLSQRNIDRAQSLLAKSPNKKLSFHHSGADAFPSNKIHPFDYAVITYVVHELDEDKRADFLRASARLAETVIIGDYLVPQPKGFWNRLNEGVEFAAGKEHYRNYKNFVAHGGIQPLLQAAGLNIHHEIRNTPSTSHIVLARPIL